MPQLLNLSRAARLAGVSRGEIQKKISSGELQTFEGDVKITDLLRVFPKIDLDHDPTLERMERIKANAHPKFPWQQSEPPSVETLLKRLQNLSGLLVQTKSQLDQNVELLKTVTHRLGELGEDAGRDGRASGIEGGSALQSQVRSLHRWLTENRDNQDLEPNKSAILFTKNLLLHIVAPHVEVVPSGREFLVEGGDTVLDAAIRSGVNVGFGCGDGSCGDCKARVISGKVLETRKPGYVLSEHERRMGYMLMCCNTAVTDLTIEAAETNSPADLPRQSVETSVSAVQDLGEDWSLLHLKTPKAQNFRFFAGQKAVLTSPKGTCATLPIVSCPCDRENLHFIIPKQRDEAQSKTSLAGMQRGDTLTVSGPEGSFVLRGASTNPSLFIVCDGGFAPVKSMIEHAISIDRIEAFHLYRYASPQAPAYYHNLCRAWQGALENFTYTALQWAEGSAPDLSRVTSDITEISRFDAYVAGPKAFTEVARNMLMENGLTSDRLSMEIIPD